MKIIKKIILALVAVMAIDTLGASSVSTQEVDLDAFCNKFPLNSRCEDHKSTKPETELEPKIHKMSRNDFCDKFQFNSECQKPPLQVIKLKLDGYGEDDEWIFIEKQANKIRLLHTTKTKDALVSGVLNGAIGALVPIPLPFVEANKYDWENGKTMDVKFESNDCQANSCAVTGKNTLILPEGTNIYQGLFTINYQEKNLKRSVSFVIPPDLKAETNDEITFKH